MHLPIPDEVRKVIEDVPRNTEAIVGRLDRVIELLEGLQPKSLSPEELLRITQT